MVPSLRRIAVVGRVHGCAVQGLRGEPLIRPGEACLANVAAPLRTGACRWSRPACIGGSGAFCIALYCGPLWLLVLSCMYFFLRVFS